MAKPRPEITAVGDSRPLWFTPPDGEEQRRETLTRGRVVAEAVTVIGLTVWTH